MRFFSFFLFFFFKHHLSTRSQLFSLGHEQQNGDNLYDLCSDLQLRCCPLAPRRTKTALVSGKKEDKGAWSEDGEWAVLTGGVRRVVEVVGGAAVDGSLLEVGHLVHVLRRHRRCVSISVFHTSHRNISNISAAIRGCFR